MNHGILGVQMLRPLRFKQTCASLVVVRFHHVSPTSTANLGNEEKESRSITETSRIHPKIGQSFDPRLDLMYHLDAFLFRSRAAVQPS